MVCELGECRYWVFLVDISVFRVENIVGIVWVILGSMGEGGFYGGGFFG